MNSATDLLMDKYCYSNFEHFDGPSKKWMKLRNDFNFFFFLPGSERED